MIKPKLWKFVALTIVSVVVGCGTISVPGRNRTHRGPEPAVAGSSRGSKAVVATSSSREPRHSGFQPVQGDPEPLACHSPHPEEVPS